MRFWWLTLGVAALISCADDGGASDGDSGDTETTGMSTDPPTSTTPTGTSESATEGTGTDTGQPETRCDRWLADRADMSEGSWSGNVGACDPGDISAEGRANALKILNLYRWLADLPPVETDPTRDAKAQECALMMHANDSLSHTPPMSWTCWTPSGAEGAGSSNISGTPGVTGVDLYMADPGNPTTIGHRRWILSNSLGPTGLGSTSQYSCMWTLGGMGAAGKPWTAWPPPGEVPFGVFVASWAPLDETGWTVQSDDVELAGAQVTVTSGGEELAVSVTNLAPGYGSSSAISFIPQGWTTQPGTTYHVEVSGVSMPIAYDVDVVACG